MNQPSNHRVNLLNNQSHQAVFCWVMGDQETALELKVPKSIPFPLFFFPPVCSLPVPQVFFTPFTIPPISTPTNLHRATEIFDLRPGRGTIIFFSSYTLLIMDCDILPSYLLDTINNKLRKNVFPKRHLNIKHYKYHISISSGCVVHWQTTLTLISHMDNFTPACRFMTSLLQCIPLFFFFKRH